MTPKINQNQGLEPNWSPPWGSSPIGSHFGSTGPSKHGPFAVLGVVFIGFVGASGVLGIVSVSISTQFWSFRRPAGSFCLLFDAVLVLGLVFSGFSMLFETALQHSECFWGHPRHPRPRF